MDRDLVDGVVQDWSEQRPDLDAGGLAIANRISLLRKVFVEADKRALRPLELAPWACDVLLALRRQGPPHQLTPTDLRRVTLLPSNSGKAACSAASGLTSPPSTKVARLILTVKLPT